MKYFIFIALWALGSAACPAQEEKTLKEANVTPTNAAISKFQINDIKGRGIIVRLKTNQDRIDAYRKEGYKKVADALDDKSKHTNLLLAYAFIIKWTYGPLYFMESQYTSKLMQSDTLIAKTYDLERDTAIYVNRDSFYLVDYGDLMANDPLNTNTTYKNVGKTEQSSQPVGGSYLVTKNNKQEQLQYPMPFYAKVVFDDMTNTTAIQPLYLPDRLLDSIIGYEAKYATINDLIKSEAKPTLARYLTIIYNHVIATSAGNHYVKAVDKMNNNFIAYYCKRLDKDRNLACNDDPYYWWLRNPNIRYLTALPQIELRLKYNTDKDPKSTKKY